MRARRMITGVLTTALLGAGGVAVADAAFAQPASCSGNSTTLTVGSGGGMTGRTSSYCSVVQQRVITAEIKWNKQLSTDPLTAKNSAAAYDVYNVQVQTCDNGNTRGYYARGYFTTNTTYYDTTPRDIKTC